MNVGSLVVELIGSLGRLALEFMADDNEETIDEQLARLSAVLVAAEKGLHQQLQAKQAARLAALAAAVPGDDE